MDEMKKSEQLFNKALLSLPAPYKALLAGAAFSALNDLNVAEMVRSDVGCAPSDNLVEAAGVFLDLRSLFDTVDWQSELAQHINVDRTINHVTGEWNIPF